MGMPMFPPGYPMRHAMRGGSGYGAAMKAGPSVLSVARRTGEFTALLKAVEAAGLAGLSEGELCLYAIPGNAQTTFVYTLRQRVISSDRAED